MDRYTHEIYSTLFREYGDVVTIQEMAKMLKCGRTTCYKLIEEGKIRTIDPKERRKKTVAKVFIIDYVLGLESDLGPFEPKKKEGKKE